ncbi:hypothetical protein [Coleofasciculus sp. FACHB-SPT9]|nr:hypothetical protein [Coleofasciculus sp. FACHB-SPT9]
MTRHFLAHLSAVRRELLLIDAIAFWYADTQGRLHYLKRLG